MNFINKFWRWIFALLVGGVVLAANIQTPELSVKEQLTGKNQIEKANIKSTEIAKLDLRGQFTSGDYTIEITSPITKIDGGIEFYAKAWDKKGNPIGFGKDNLTETERFRIFNPPIMVPDGTKKNETITLGGKEKVIEVDNFREDLGEAVKQVLAHTISVSGKPNKDIVKGSVGHTTDTFYAAEDGYVAKTGTSLTWANLIIAAGTNVDRTSASTVPMGIHSSATSGQFNELYRSIYVFSTGATLPDGDDISSATFSLYGAGAGDNSLGADPDTNVYAATPANEAAIAAGDFTNIGSTAFSTAITYAGWNTADYNDFTLNTAGKAAINKTGNTDLGVRNANHDVANSAPAWSSNDYSYTLSYYSEQGGGGTTNDPKLVVVHAPAGPTGVKTLNDLVIGIVKTINDVAIGSIKTING